MRGAAWGDAAAVLDSMRRFRIAADAVTMELAVAGAGADWELAIQRYERMLQAGVTPSYGAVSALLAVLVAARRSEEATALLESMREQVEPPSLALPCNTTQTQCRIHNP